MSSTRCTATTRAGRRCRRRVKIDDGEELHGAALCSAHAGRARGGAPPGNQNARKDGFYASTLTGAELADLVTAAEATSLKDEIAVTRVMLRRLLQYLQDQELDPAEIKRIAPLTIEATGRIARLLKDDQHIAGDEADAFRDIIGGALDLLSEEWDVEL